MIGSIVIYRTDGRNGLSYDLPAIITCTHYSHPGDYPDGRKNPLPVPRDEHHVHLTVFTPGGFGTYVSDSTDALNREPRSGDFPNASDLFPGSGTYVEWNVPCYAEAIDTNHDRRERIPPRTWRWRE